LALRQRSAYQTYKKSRNTYNYMSNQEPNFNPRRKPPFIIEALAWLFIHIPYYAVFYFSVRILGDLIKKNFMQ